MANQIPSYPIKIGDMCFKKKKKKKKTVATHFLSQNIDDYNKLSAITPCPITGDLLLV